MLCIERALATSRRGLTSSAERPFSWVSLYIADIGRDGQTLSILIQLIEESS